MMPEFEQLIAFVAKTKFDDLPADIVARAKITFMDTIGAILAGVRLPEVNALGELAARSSGERIAALIGRWEKADPYWACLYHGTAGTSFELDEGHAFSKGHPAIHTLPSALALGEKTGASGKDVLTAFVLGYEVAARVGTGSHLRLGTHPHGTWGTLGAAAAAAKLLGADVARMSEGIRIAANLTLATSFQTAFDGSSVRNAYAGVAAHLGLLSVHLAGCQFTGERNPLATVFGNVMSDGFNAAALIEKLGERYEISRGYFKNYACCRYNHATLDALKQLRAEKSFAIREVARVQVETYHLAAQLRDQEPVTPLGARFSIPFAVAAMLVTGGARPAAFEREALENKAIREIAKRVDVREDAALTAMLPANRPARVTIQLTNGNTLTKMVDHSKGDPAEPFSRDELIAKYFELAEPVIGQPRAARAQGMIENLENVQDIREVTQWLTPAS